MEIDYTIYKFMNPDLYHMNNEQLIEHYYSWGYKENRNKTLNDFLNAHPNFKNDINSIPEYINKAINRDFDVKLYNTFPKDSGIFSLRTFYNKYPKFEYHMNDNKTEVDMIIHWYKNRRKNIIIYPHSDFNLSDGGVTVQYYLAQILFNMGERVRIYSRDIRPNPLYNNYYNNDFDMDNTVVIYCEGIIGNPLNAKYVVRWVLSELGKNVPKDRYLTWGKNDLIYYFNNNIASHKYLTLLYLNPNIKNYNNNRGYSWCHTFRKFLLNTYHNNVKYIHPENSFEITRHHTQDDYIKIFNENMYFISYDPLTFLNIIAVLCGCISIVYPIENKSKKEWLKETALWGYLEANNLDNIYGIAYGIDDIEYAQNTIQYATEQINDIINYSNKTVDSFIKDINNM